MDKRTNFWVTANISPRISRTLFMQWCTSIEELPRLGIQLTPPETYPVNDVLPLDIIDSIHNPMNHRFYLASEYYDIVIVVTELGLTAFSDTTGMPSISGPQFATFSPSGRKYLCIHR